MCTLKRKLPNKSERKWCSAKRWTKSTADYSKTNSRMDDIEILWVNNHTHTQTFTMPASYIREIERQPDRKKRNEKSAPNNQICYDSEWFFLFIWTNSIDIGNNNNNVIAAIVVLYVIIEFCFVPVYLCLAFYCPRHFTNIYLGLSLSTFVMICFFK